MEKGIAIITGADGGMGREITLALAKEGFQIIMACKEPDPLFSAREDQKRKRERADRNTTDRLILTGFGTLICR